MLSVNNLAARQQTISLRPDPAQTRVALASKPDHQKRSQIIRSNSTCSKSIIIRYSQLVLLGALVVLTAGRTNAQSEQPKQIELLNHSLRIIQGQTARISLILPRLANPHLPNDSISARIQVLGTEGEVLVQSSELNITPGQTRCWDVPRCLLPASRDVGGRRQVRVRLLVTTLSADLDLPSVIPTIEVIDEITGGTMLQMGKTFLIFVSSPNRTNP